MTAGKVRELGYSVTLPSLPLLAGAPIREKAHKSAILAGLNVTGKQMAVEAMTRETSSYTEQAWYMLTEEQQKQLASAIFAATLKQAKDISGVVKGMIDEFIQSTAQSVLDFKKEEIREAIEKELESRWRSHVEDLVRKTLEDAIVRIKAEMVK